MTSLEIYVGTWVYSYLLSQSGLPFVQNCQCGIKSQSFILSILLTCFVLQPELDVVISVNEPLFDSSQESGGNLLTFTAESLYSPPDSWSPVGPQHTYTVALPVPISGEVRPDDIHLSSRGYVR